MNNRQEPGAPPPGGLSPAQLQALLRLAGSAAGPDGAQNGAAERLARSMTPEQTRRLERILSDPEETRRLLSSRQARLLFEKLGKK